MQIRHSYAYILLIFSFIFSTILLSGKSYAKGEIDQDNQEAILVNLNTATYEEILTIPFVGPGRAKAIMEYREKRTFKRKEDLMKIKGIGPKLFKKIAPYVFIELPQKNSHNKLSTTLQ